MQTLKRVLFWFLTSAIVMTASLPVWAAQAGKEKSAAIKGVIDKIVQRENELMEKMRNYTPLVETYIQNLVNDNELGAVPKSDTYFLGKLDMSNGFNEKSFMPEVGGGFVSRFLRALQPSFSFRYHPHGFAQMILVSASSMQKENYEFEYVRREFLGEVRCLVFDVKPSARAPRGTFLGRIWAEDQDYNILRLNGTYSHSTPKGQYFHFDSWRQYMGPGLWLPAYVYAEESDNPKGSKKRKFWFKAQTRLWGYATKQSWAQNEFTSMRVEALSVRDTSETAQDLSPVLSTRLWERQAEDNVVERMERAGLLAPEGEVTGILDTVVNNLEITNNLDIQPKVRCRVLLTSPLESFTIGHTIVLSRGLIDVLPDEASLATMLSHELAHIILGHRLDTKYAFNDRTQFNDEEAFKRLLMRREEQEEVDADTKALELLKNSPYKDKLGNAGLFLLAVNSRASQLPGLLRPHMGNRMIKGPGLTRLNELTQSAPELEMKNKDQIAALPLGGRVKVNPWNNTIELIKSKPVALLSAREKMPFELTPIILNLRRQPSSATASPLPSRGEQISQGATK